MNKHAVVAAVGLSLLVAACGKESSSAAPTADAKPTTPAANAPAKPADEKPALPPSVKTAAPGAGMAAPDVPAGTSGPPTMDEWNAAAGINTAEKNSVAKDCTMKMVREWLKVNCTGKIKEVTNMDGFGKKNVDYFELVTPGKVADFVVRVKKGGSLKVRILRDGEPGASLFMNWPGQLEKPSIIALANFAGLATSSRAGGGHARRPSAFQTDALIVVRGAFAGVGDARADQAVRAAEFRPATLVEDRDVASL